jgi:hypothetical protein
MSSLTPLIEPELAAPVYAIQGGASAPAGGPIRSGRDAAFDGAQRADAGAGCRPRRSRIA